MAESDLAVRTVIVYRQICQLFIASPRDEPMDERRAQRTIAELTFDVVDALARRMHLANVQGELPIRVRRSGQQYRAVLVPVPRKKVAAHSIKFIACEADSTFFFHGNFSRKSRIFNIFAVAFCSPFCAAPLRRDTCIAGRPSN